MPQPAIVYRIRTPGRHKLASRGWVFQTIHEERELEFNPLESAQQGILVQFHCVPNLQQDNSKSADEKRHGPGDHVWRALDAKELHSARDREANGNGRAKILHDDESAGSPAEEANAGNLPHRWKHPLRRRRLSTTPVA
jgi:hypothetical protein